MTTLRVSARATLPGLTAAVQALGAPFGDERGRRTLEAMRGVIAREFAQGGGFLPSGGVTRWPPTEAFGTRAATNPPLGGAGGGLARAWAGGPGGFERINPRSVTLGVTRPDVDVHRGGARGQRRSTAIRARRISRGGLPAMFWFLGLEFSVWISPEKLLGEGVVVPARPHALNSRQMKVAVVDSVLEDLRRAA